MKKLLLIIVGVCVSCRPIYWEYDTRSFVLYYAYINKVNLYFDKNERTCVATFVSGSSCGISSVPSSKIIYDKLCEKHGDVTYNRKVREYANELSDYRCAEDFVNIEISSSADWDADHPAGSSLGDIVRFVSNTPLPYIRSGYTKKYSEKKGGEYYPIDKLVSELTLADMILLPINYGVDKYFRFTQPPTLSREHTLTVRLTTDEGKVFTASVDAVF